MSQTGSNTSPEAQVRASGRRPRSVQGWAATSQATQHLLHSTVTVLNWTRLALAAHMAAFNAVRVHHVAHPVWMVTLTLVVLIWSLLLAATHCEKRLLPIDLGLTLVLVLVSALVLGPAVHGGLLTVYWQVAAPVAAAVYLGPLPGIAGASAVAIAGFLQSPRLQGGFWSEGLLAILLTWAVGQLVSELRRTAAERDRTLANEVRLAERDRLNRILHDGALQVLSLVEREGPALGHRGLQLAQLARAQDLQLRRMLQDRTVRTDESDAEVDVAALIDELASDKVTVSMMADAVLMRRDRAIEVQAAVGQALLNAELHAGEQAQVWVLVEVEAGVLTISIRDNGQGMSVDKLKDALARGRMGIKGSIIGRIRDLGGRAKVRSSPGRGVEWELQVPLDPDHPLESERSGPDQ